MTQKKRELTKEEVIAHTADYVGTLRRVVGMKKQEFQIFSRALVYFTAAIDLNVPAIHRYLLEVLPGVFKKVGSPTSSMRHYFWLRTRIKLQNATGYNFNEFGFVFDIALMNFIIAVVNTASWKLDYKVSSYLKAIELFESDEKKITNEGLLDDVNDAKSAAERLMKLQRTDLNNKLFADLMLIAFFGLSSFMRSIDQPFLFQSIMPIVHNIRFDLLRDVYALHIHQQRVTSDEKVKALSGKENQKILVDLNSLTVQSAQGRQWQPLVNEKAGSIVYLLDGDGLTQAELKENYDNLKHAYSDQYAQIVMRSGCIVAYDLLPLSPPIDIEEIDIFTNPDLVMPAVGAYVMPVADKIAELSSRVFAAASSWLGSQYLKHFPQQLKIEKTVEVGGKEEEQAAAATSALNVKPSPTKRRSGRGRKKQPAAATPVSTTLAPTSRSPNKEVRAQQRAEARARMENMLHQREEELRDFEARTKADNEKHEEYLRELNEPREQSSTAVIQQEVETSLPVPVIQKPRAVPGEKRRRSSEEVVNEIIAFVSHSNTRASGITTVVVELRGPQLEVELDKVVTLFEGLEEEERKNVLQTITDDSVDELVAVSIVDGRLDLLRLLQASGINFNKVIDDQGWWPIHYAASLGKLDVVEYLLSVDGNSEFKLSVSMSSAKTSAGESAYQIACQKGFVDIARCLLSSSVGLGEFLASNKIVKQLSKRLVEAKAVDVHYQHPNAIPIVANPVFNNGMDKFVKDLLHKLSVVVGRNDFIYLVSGSRVRRLLTAETSPIGSDLDLTVGVTKQQMQGALRSMGVEATQSSRGGTLYIENRAGCPRIEINLLTTANLEEDCQGRDAPINTFMYDPREKCVFSRHPDAMPQLIDGVVDMIGSPQRLSQEPLLFFRYIKARVDSYDAGLGVYRFNFSSALSAQLHQQSHLALSINSSEAFFHIRKLVTSGRSAQFFDTLKLVGLRDVMFPLMSELSDDQEAFIQAYLSKIDTECGGKVLTDEQNNYVVSFVIALTSVFKLGGGARWNKALYQAIISPNESQWPQVIAIMDQLEGQYLGRKHLAGANQLICDKFILSSDARSAPGILGPYPGVRR